MQVSREMDLEQLKQLGFNMYGNVDIARRKLYESISNGDKRNGDICVYDEITSRSYDELKTLLRKNDYMQRCTNTNAKAAVLAYLILGEFEAKVRSAILKRELSSSPEENAKVFTEQTVHYFTERKVHPYLQRVPMFSDVIDSLSFFANRHTSENFYESMMDYLANVIFDFGI